jgi:sec-independent protein translocase protein TatA
MNISLPALAFLNLGSGDILLVMFLCLLMFGSKKLPELAKAFGQSMREFKKAANEVEDNFHSAVKEEERKKVLPPTIPVASTGGPLDTVQTRPVNPPEKL